MDLQSYVDKLKSFSNTKSFKSSDYDTQYQEKKFCKDALKIIQEIENNINNNSLKLKDYYNILFILNVYFKFLKDKLIKERIELINKIKSYQEILVQEFKNSDKKSISAEDYYQVSFQSYFNIGYYYFKNLQVLNDKLDSNKISEYECNPFPIIDNIILSLEKAYLMSSKLLKIKEKSKLYTNYYIDTLTMLAELYNEELEQYEISFSFYNKIEKIGGDYVKVEHYQKLGQLKFQCNDFSEAANYFELVVKKIDKQINKDDYLDAYSNLLQCYINIGDYEEFNKVLKEFKKLNSNDTKALNLINKLLKWYNINNLIDIKKSLINYEKLLHQLNSNYENKKEKQEEQVIQYHKERLKILEPTIKSLVSMSIPSPDKPDEPDENECVFVEKKLRYRKLMEESYEYLNDRNGLLVIYENVSCLYDNQKKKTFIKEAKNFNERILKNQILNGNNYLKSFIMINLYNARDTLKQLEKNRFSRENEIDENLYLLEDSIELLDQEYQNSSDNNNKIKALNLKSIAFYSLATFYQKSNKLDKFKEYCEKKEEIDNLIDSLENGNNNIRSSINSDNSDNSDNISNDDSNNKQIIKSKNEDEDYFDEDDYNTSLENLSLEDPILLLENGNQDDEDDRDDDKKSNFSNSTNYSSNSYSHESSIKKNKLDQLLNKKNLKKREDNEIIDESYLLLVQRNENNKRDLNSINRDDNEFTPNKKFRQTRKSLHIGSAFEEVDDGIFINKATGEEFKSPLEIVKSPSKQFSSNSNSGISGRDINDNSNSSNNRNNNGNDNYSNIQLPKPESNDVILISDEENNNNNFNIGTPTKNNKSKLNNRRLFINKLNEKINNQKEKESNKIEDDYEEEEFHPPEHYDKNGQLLPCYTNQFIVSNDIEEEDNYEDKLTNINTPTKSSSNNNGNINSSTPKNINKPPFTNSPSHSSPLNSNNNNSNENNYKVIQVEIFLEIILYIPLAGLGVEEFDFIWLKDRCEERIKLLSFHEDLGISITGFKCSSEESIKFDSKLKNYINKKIVSTFNKKIQDIGSTFEELYLKDDQCLLENGYYADFENQITDSYLYDLSTKYYFETFRNRRCIESVKINNQILGEQSVENLGKILSTLSNTEKLFLINCRLNSNSIQILSKYTNKLKLHHLDLSFNNLSNLINNNNSSHPFFNLNSTISLNISYCNLNSNSTPVLTESIISAKYLQVLKLNGNSDIGDSGFLLLSKGLSKLIEFEARSCSLGKLEFNTLKQLFKSLSNCSNLDIGSNQLGNNNGQKILKAFTSNIKDGIQFNELCQLKIDSIGINQHSVDELLLLLKNIPKLSRLFAKNNNFDLDGLKKLNGILSNLTEVSL